MELSNYINMTVRTSMKPIFINLKVCFLVCPFYALMKQRIEMTLATCVVCGIQSSVHT